MFFYLAIAVAVPETAFAQYRIVPIDIDSQTTGRPEAINESGTVVGSARVSIPDSSNFLNRAFTWDSASGGQLLPPIDPQRIGSNAFAVNEAGLIGGGATSVLNGQQSSSATLWSEGQASQLASTSAPLGTVFGLSADVSVGETRSGDNRAFIHRPDTGTQVLSPLGNLDESQARAVNSLGDVIGVSTRLVPAGNFGFTRNPTATYWNSDGDPVSLPGPTGQLVERSSANDINENSVIAGSLRTDDLYAAIWSEFGSPTLISYEDVLPPGDYFSRFIYFNAINDNGLAAGNIGIYGRGRQQPSAAFIWTPEQDAVLAEDLLTSEFDGWEITRLNDVNNQGFAVGQGVDPAGNTRGVLLVPVGVPEPGGYLLLCICFSQLCLRRTKR
jgi:hypothetical protein